MKRPRNIQKVKEQDKCTPNQTKEEEIGNLLDKEFRIMIVKLIQNLEIKMESQINSMETRITIIKQMSKQVPRGSVDHSQAEEQAGVARLSWRISRR